MDERRSQEYFIDRATCRKNDLAKEIFEAAQHHIDSFNSIYENGLRNICTHLNPIELSNEEDSLKNVPFSKMRIWFEDFSIGYNSIYPGLPTNKAN